MENEKVVEEIKDEVATEIAELEQKRQQGKPVTCQRCGHAWNYTGDSKWRASCPICGTSVNVREKKTPGTEGN